MSRRPQPQSLISKIQSQVSHTHSHTSKDNSRRFSKDLTAKRSTIKPTTTYTSAFINSQLRNKSFDSGNAIGNGRVEDSFMSRGSLDERRYGKERGEREKVEKEKMHESFSHLKDTHQDIRSKSLYFTEFNTEQPNKKEKNIKLSDYFQKCGQLMTKISISQQDKPSLLSPFPLQLISQFSDFKLTDISSLIQLIDTCVLEANSYISDLTCKMQRLIEESEQLKRVNRRLEEMNKVIK